MMSPPLPAMIVAGANSTNVVKAVEMHSLAMGSLTKKRTTAVIAMSKSMKTLRRVENNSCKVCDSRKVSQ